MAIVPKPRAADRSGPGRIGHTEDHYDLDRIKLADSRVQLDLAEGHVADGAIVRSCINAFISLARSVTFVMQAESGIGTPLRVWYDAELATLKADALMRNFAEQRTFTIHRGNVHAKAWSFHVLAPQCASRAAGGGPQRIVLARQ